MTDPDQLELRYKKLVSASTLALQYIVVRWGPSSRAAEELAVALKESDVHSPYLDEVLERMDRKIPQN